MTKKIIFIIITSIFPLLIFSDQNSEEPSMKDFLSEYYAQNLQHFSKLLYAVQMNYRNIAFKLISAGENPNLFSWPVGTNPNLVNGPPFTSPFLLAIYKEDDELVSAMLNKGAKENHPAFFPGYGDFQYPLEFAMLNNKSANITRLLCDRNAYMSFIIKNDGKYKNTWKLHPFGIIVTRGDVSKVVIVGERLSDDQLRQIDQYGNSLLTIFSPPSSNEYKEITIIIANYLINKGMPLENEKKSSLSHAIFSGNLELFEFLFSIGANINYLGYGIHENPLCAAIYYSCLGKKRILNDHPECERFIAQEFEFLNRLLNAGVTINFSFPKNGGGYTPLTFAIINKSIEAVDLLIAYGADVDMMDNQGKTPLIWAVEIKSLDIVKLLLDLGANPRKAGENGKIPSDAASDHEILNALIEAEARQLDSI